MGPAPGIKRPSVPTESMVTIHSFKKEGRVVRSVHFVRVSLSQSQSQTQSQSLRVFFYLPPTSRLVATNTPSGSFFWR
jgi:hypothetical protein